MKSHNIDITEDMKIGLLQVMSLTVANGEKELEFLQRMVKTQEAKSVNFTEIMEVSKLYRKNVVGGLLYFLRAAIDLKKPTHIAIIVKALPLYHFLSGFSVPNQSPRVLLENVPWKLSMLNLDALKAPAKDKPGLENAMVTIISLLVQFY